MCGLKAVIARGRSLIAMLKANGFLRQVSSMMMLTALGQALYVAAGPIVGRIYSPAEFGYFGLFITIWTSLALFSCGLYDLAIPAVTDDEEARRLSGTCAIVGVAFSILAGSGLCIAITQKWFGLGIYPLWMAALMATGILTQMAVLIAQSWAVRQNNVLDIGRANIIMNGSRGAFQITGGLLCPTWAMLVAGEVVARIAQAKFLLKMSGRRLNEIFCIRFFFVTVRKHRRYPLVFGPVFALDSITNFLQTAIIGFLFGPVEMGLFFLMRRTLDLPVAFAFKSLSDLFFSQQLDLMREDPSKLRPFFIRYSSMLAASGIIIGAPLIFGGEFLFKIFYGPNWGLAGVLAGFMVPAMIANIAVAPVARIFQLSRKMYLRILPAITNFTGTLMVFWLADYFQFGFEKTTASISIVIFVHYVIYFCVGLFVAGSICIEQRDSKI